MANLIITVIAIALVAISSLMGIYYGGSAYLNNTQNANASTVMNEGVQLVAAWQAYLMDNGVQIPTVNSQNDVGPLVTQKYLSRWPQFPTSVGTDAADRMGSYFVVQSTTNSHYYGVAVIGTPAASATPGINDIAAQGCKRIIKTALGANPTAMPQEDFGTLVQGGANIGTPLFGCGIVNSGANYSIFNNSVTGNYTLPQAITYVTYYLLS